jgi:lipoprotein signal peptidase
MIQNSNKSAMQNGLIAGALIALKFLFTALKIPVLSSLTFFISIGIVVFLFYVAKRFRVSENGDTMTFGEAFGYVFRVYFYGAVIGSLVVLVYTLINVEFLAILLNDTLMLYDKINIPIDDTTYDMLNSIFKPAPYALFNLFGSAIVAAFWGLILGLFLKKEKSIFEE